MLARIGFAGEPGRPAAQRPHRWRERLVPRLADLWQLDWLTGRSQTGPSGEILVKRHG
jgi:hypothetical protein